jgi:hypothetical protein
MADTVPPGSEGDIPSKKTGIGHYYSPLPAISSGNIRLVYINPGESTADLVCTLIQVNLDEAPPYEALSYCWGDPAITEQIFLDNRRISVTKNCHSALSRLRLPARERLMWIDAICIDQTNIQERNDQVAMMGQIYNKATRVVIDVGEASEDSALALDAIENCADDKLYGFHIGLRVRDAVGDFYRRAWFSRVWVLQEVFMSANAIVMCGNMIVNWSTIRPRRIWVDSRPAREAEHWHVELPAVIPYVLSIGSHQSRRYSAREDIFQLLLEGASCNATDARDKVFALLPMVHDALDCGLKADYSKPVSQVYMEIAVWLLQKVGVSFLSLSGLSIIGTPSWVVDWSRRVRVPWILGLSEYYPRSASGNSRPTASLYNIPGSPLLSSETPLQGLQEALFLPHLLIRRLVVDTVLKTSGVIPIRSGREDCAQFVSECRAHRTKTSKPPIDIPYNRRWRPRTSEFRLHPEDWMLEYGVPLERPLEKTDNEMADLMTYFVSGRQLILTEQGFFGLAPETARSGDTICCFLGVGFPFTIRKDERDWTRQQLYKIVGESYVWGLMEGEAFRDIDMSKANDDQPPSPLQDFHFV